MITETESKTYLEKRMDFINAGRPLPKKKIYRIAKVSKKRKEKLKQQGATLSEEDSMTAFFEKQRPKMIGVCQCGCAQKSQKADDTFFSYCICHIFPKSIFESVRTHPLNWVERTFIGGHHTNFDEQGMDKWPMMADWDDIKEKFHQLAPLLTEDERKTKFYSKLESLVYKHS